VYHADYLPSRPRRTLSRQPSREPPTQNLGIYTITIPVVMTLAPEP
jgi:hypothetical protein